MSPRIKDSSVEAVLSAANIVDVVSGYTSLRKRGGTYVGLCPFHQEKTPSFTVSAEKGLYYCFGCGEGGDTLRFLERMESLSFTEAVEQLSRRYGIPLEFEEGSGPDGGRKDRETRLLEVLEKAARFYERYLWETESGRTAREYLTARGLEEESCRLFRVGLAPADWQGIYRRAVKEGFTAPELEEAGLIVRQPGKVYDRFRDRLMFPLVDHRGRVLGFGGRTLKDETPKYINSPEGPLYQKGKLLYGLYQARRAIADHDEVVVVEGYTDVIGLAQAGVGNVVASMGTALTDSQLGLMMRFTSNVTFMFDADRAGTEAALRSGELARSRGLRPTVAVLPGGRDPADVAVKGGAEAVSRLLADKVSLLGFEVRQVLAQKDVATAQGRVRAFEQVREIMGRAFSPKEREEEIAVVADRLRLSADSVALLLRSGGRGQGRRSDGQAAYGRRARTPAPASVDAARERPDRLSYTMRLLSAEAVVERDFLVAAVCNPQAALPLLEALTPEHFSDPDNCAVFAGVLEAFRTVADGSDEGMALAHLRSCARTDSAAGRLFIRLLVELDEGRYGPAVLEELHLRLQEQYLVRSINRLREWFRDGEPTEADERHLFHLERLLQSVRMSLTNLDPEEGRS